eukprot:gene10979-3051_t
MESISVSIRLRPLNEREQQASAHNSWVVERDSIAHVHRSGKKSHGAQYTFDNIFDVDASTKHVYQKCAGPVVNGTMSGMHGTIFAYGQTSSGKTHTMMGDSNACGIVPLAIQDIFHNIEKTPDREFLLRVSFMEIYNEIISDLLNPSNVNLKIQENEKGDVTVGGLTEEVICSPEEILQHMSNGQKLRRVGSTRMNDQSSRSHTIFRIIVESRECFPHDQNDGRNSMDGYGAVRVAHLNLVDLAGSERVAQTGAEGQRLKEGAMINKSLLTLGTVIAKLSDGVTSETGHIPYRDSKLTRILQNSLGGNTRTAIICTITPASLHAEESFSTLKFASRAKAIQNKVEINEVYDDAAMLRKMQREISQLKKRNQLLEDGTEMQMLKSEKQSLEQALRQRDANYKQQATQLDRLKRVILTSAAVHSLVAPETLPYSKDCPFRKDRRKTWCPGQSEDSIAIRSAGLLFSPTSRNSIEEPSNGQKSVQGNDEQRKITSCSVRTSNRENIAENDASNNVCDDHHFQLDNFGMKIVSHYAKGTNYKCSTTPTSNGKKYSNFNEDNTTRLPTLWPNGHRRSLSGTVSSKGMRYNRNDHSIEQVPSVHVRRAKKEFASFKRKARARRSLSSSTANLQLMRTTVASDLASTVRSHNLVPEQRITDDSDTKIRALSTRVEIFKTKAKKLQSDLIKKDEELSVVKDELSLNQNTVSDLEKEVLHLRENLSNQKAMMEGLEGRFVEIQQQHEAEIQEANESTHFLQHELEILREIHEQDLELTKSLKDHVGTLEHRVTETKERAVKAENNAAAHEIKIDELENLNSEFLKRISDLESELMLARSSAEEKAHAILITEIAEANNKVRDAEKSRQLAEDNAYALDLKLSSTQKKLEEAITELNLLRNGPGLDAQEEPNFDVQFSCASWYQIDYKNALQNIRKLVGDNGGNEVEVVSIVESIVDCKRDTEARLKELVREAENSYSEMKGKFVELEEERQSLLQRLSKYEKTCTTTNDCKVAHGSDELQSASNFSDSSCNCVLNTANQIPHSLRKQTIHEELEEKYLEKQRALIESHQKQIKDMEAAYQSQLQCKAKNLEELQFEVEALVRDAELQNQNNQPLQKHEALGKEKSPSPENNFQVKLVLPKQAIESNQKDLQEQIAKMQDKISCYMKQEAQHSNIVAKMQEEICILKNELKLASAEVKGARDANSALENKITLLENENDCMKKLYSEKSKNSIDEITGMSYDKCDTHNHDISDPFHEAKPCNSDQNHPKTNNLSLDYSDSTETTGGYVEGDVNWYKYNGCEGRAKKNQEAGFVSLLDFTNEIQSLRIELMEMTAERDALQTEYHLLKNKLEEQLLYTKKVDAHAFETCHEDQEKFSACHSPSKDTNQQQFEPFNNKIKEEHTQLCEPKCSVNVQHCVSDSGDGDSPKRKGNSVMFGRHKRKKKLGNHGEVCSPTTLAPKKMGLKGLVSKLVTPIMQRKRKSQNTVSPKELHLDISTSTEITNHSSSSSNESYPKTTVFNISDAHFISNSPTLPSAKEKKTSAEIDSPKDLCKIKEIETRLGDYEVSSQKLRSELSIIQRKKEEAQDHINQLIQQNNEYNEYIAKLEKQAQQLTKELDIHIFEKTTAIDEHEATKQKLSEMQKDFERLGDVEYRLNIIQDENLEMSNYIEELENANEQLLSKIDASSKEVKAKAIQCNPSDAMLDFSTLVERINVQTNGNSKDEQCHDTLISVSQKGTDLSQSELNIGCKEPITNEEKHFISVNSDNIESEQTDTRILRSSPKQEVVQQQSIINSISMQSGVSEQKSRKVEDKVAALRSQLEQAQHDRDQLTADASETCHLKEQLLAAEERVKEQARLEAEVAALRSQLAASSSKHSMIAIS